MSKLQSEDVQEQGLIIFDQGGLVRGDAPQNQELLGLIQKVPVLQPETLLRLANYYKSGYPTLAPLGDHLLMHAAANLAENTTPQIATVFRNAYADWWDGVEDAWIFPGDSGSDERRESYALRLAMRCVPFKGIQLLIETFTAENKSPQERGPQVKSWHFVLGICPWLNGLPAVSTRGERTAGFARVRPRG